MGFKKELINEAENGREAIQLFEKSLTAKKKYELIITDLNMPEINGLQLSKKVRKHEDNIAKRKKKKTTKREIIMLNSGNDMNTDKFLLECSQAQITAIFPKPYVFSEIKRLMSRYFQLPQ